MKLLDTHDEDHHNKNLVKSLPLQEKIKTALNKGQSIDNQFDEEDMKLDAEVKRNRKITDYFELKIKQKQNHLTMNQEKSISPVLKTNRNQLPNFIK